MSRSGIECIGIAGGGLMGCGIAAKLAAEGQGVRVFESQPEALAQAPARIAAVLSELVEGHVLDRDAAAAARARITVSGDVGRLEGLPFVIEAVSESLAVKHSLYAALESRLPHDAILASSTSGLTPAQLCAGLRHPERFVVAHFWNPPHLVPLVEVVAGDRTLPAVVDDTLRVLAALGCTPVRLHKAVPGFVGNRLQFAVLREALHLLREGVADAETIDLVMTQCLGRRYAHIGPLAGADAGGLATFLAIATYLLPDLASDADALSVLGDHVGRGELGRSSGQGLHAWTPEKEAWLRKARLGILRAQRGPAPRPSPG